MSNSLTNKRACWLARSISINLYYKRDKNRTWWWWSDRCSSCNQFLCSMDTDTAVYPYISAPSSLLTVSPQNIPFISNKLKRKCFHNHSKYTYKLNKARFNHYVVQQSVNLWLSGYTLYMRKRKRNIRPNILTNKHTIWLKYNKGKMTKSMPINNHYRQYHRHRS